MKTFLSSTYQDLVEYRRVAANALERLGQEVGRMEVFGARPQEPTVACSDEVERCELFVGIYAHRYGYIPEGSGTSVTEQEFETAHRLGKSIFCFVVHEDWPWPPKWVEDEPGRAKLTAFKGRIGKMFVRDTFTTPDDLGLKVATAVGRHVKSVADLELASQAQDRMRIAGFETGVLAAGHALDGIARGEREELGAIFTELAGRVANLLRSRSPDDRVVNPKVLRVAADGLMAGHHWTQAAEAYEAYTKLAIEDWDASYLRAVAYLNARGGEKVNRQALRAISDAIAYLPPDAPPDWRARLFGYRGTVWKRLGRPEEALADLAVAERHATATYELEDVLYNQACAYALQGDREAMLRAVRALVGRRSSRIEDSVRPHLDDYFARFQDDPELLELVSERPPI